MLLRLTLVFRSVFSVSLFALRPNSGLLALTRLRPLALFLSFATRPLPPVGLPAVAALDTLGPLTVAALAAATTFPSSEGSFCSSVAQR